MTYTMAEMGGALGSEVYLLLFPNTYNLCGQRIHAALRPYNMMGRISVGIGKIAEIASIFFKVKWKEKVSFELLLHELLIEYIMFICLGLIHTS